MNSVRFPAPPKTMSIGRRGTSIRPISIVRKMDLLELASAAQTRERPGLILHGAIQADENLALERQGGVALEARKIASLARPTDDGALRSGRLRRSNN
jgi:hypothetical protein